MGEVMASAERFGHREHVKLTWLAVRRCGTADAVELISDGIQRTARYAGVPQKYNATVSRAWVELTAYHMAEAPGESFDELVRRNPGLMDKRLLTRFYHSRTLASPAARTGWVEPDLHAFPQ
jgi:CRP-like cAMP-binding protein